MDDTRKLSIKDKIKQFLCCFPTNHRETLSSDSPSSTNRRPMFLIGPPSQWIKSRASVDIPEIKYKCRNLFSRIGTSSGVQHHRCRRSSADFSYDPLSYALNFDEDSCGNVDEDDAPVKGFASRLPSSPPPSSAAVVDHRSSLVAGV